MCCHELLHGAGRLCAENELIWRKQDYFLGIFLFSFPSYILSVLPVSVKQRMETVGGSGVPLRVAHTGGCHMPMFQPGCGAC